ncbi:MAG: S8 family serine peptidase [Verrucomicrobiales bacterium]|nr:S8 family serine peptidase [Verrucomicrobiales bacterium]
MMPDTDAAWPSPADVRAALDGESTGKGIRVAIIDSGIEVTHPALEGIELVDDVAISCDGLRMHIGEGGGRDVYGHGTAVAGILKSIAPEVEIGSFRALDSKNHSRNLVIAECARQAIERGYRIINCSFGCRGLPKYVMEYKEWVDAAHTAGVHVVAACSNVGASIREWPAHFPNVISVGVADCGETDLVTRPGEMVSLAAKGERVRVPWLEGSWRVETGSSFAAPRVAGKAARILQSFPDLPAGLMKPLLEALGEIE